MLNKHKELAVVRYGDTGIKCLYGQSPMMNNSAFWTHWHERMELLLLESGRIELHLDEKTMMLEAGQLGVFPPEMLHGGICRGEGTVFHTIMFEVERFHNGTGASEKWLKPLAQRQLLFPGVVEDPAAVKAAEALVALLKDPDASSLAAVGQLYVLLGELCRFSTPGSRIPSAAEESLRSVLDYIQEHYTQQLTVGEISKAFSYNETYFCRRFKKATGLTVMEYIRILRLELAEKLLKTEKCEIRDIAWRCGFPDESYFSRAFKAHSGMTPSAFRKRG